jgi:uncharacterized protein YigE (DUF2233 family)
MMIRKFLAVVAIAILALPLAVYADLLGQRPPRTLLQQPLFQGIAYRREARSTPRPLMVHIVTVDLSAPGVEVLVTPGEPGTDKLDVAARTTAEFLQEFKLQLAINANFFYPFRENAPWDFYPRRGERVKALGQAISNGNIYAKPDREWPALCLRDRTAEIVASGLCPFGTQHAVAGSHILVSEGQAVTWKAKSQETIEPYARVVVGIDRSGQRLWIVAIDGKQPFYSEGVTLAELSQMMQQFGVRDALNLDGGGSTTLAIADPQRGAVPLNSPIHAKLPMLQRPVVNHLGFKARSLALD